jgi:hypothetical protein
MATVWYGIRMTLRKKGYFADDDFEDDTGSNDWMIVNNGLKGMRKEAVAV